VIVPLGLAIAGAQEDDVFGHLARDIASVETKTRIDALGKLIETRDLRVAPILALAAKDPDGGIRYQALKRLSVPDLAHEASSLAAIVSALDDADPEIQKLARFRLLNVTREDVARISVAPIVSRLVNAPTEGDQYHFVQILESFAESGAVVPTPPLLAVASAAKNERLRERALEVAEEIDQGYVSHVDLAAIASNIATLLADPRRHDETLKRALEATGAGSGRVLVALQRHGTDARDVERAYERLRTSLDPDVILTLLELETSSKLEDQALAREILDAHQDPRGLRGILERLATDAKDERVRKRASERLGR
jgi:hypothetical protein